MSLERTDPVLMREITRASGAVDAFATAATRLAGAAEAYIALERDRRIPDEERDTPRDAPHVDLAAAIIDGLSTWRGRVETKPAAPVPPMEGVARAFSTIMRGAGLNDPWAKATAEQNTPPVDEDVLDAEPPRTETAQCSLALKLWAEPGQGGIKMSCSGLPGARVHALPSGTGLARFVEYAAEHRRECRA